MMTSFTVQNQLDPGLGLGFNFPHLDSIVPAIGLLASGVVAYSITRLKSNPDFQLGEWILFTSPTTFNRFVFLRCPSIMFQGSELLEDVNDKLINQDRHFVKFNVPPTDVDYNNYYYSNGKERGRQKQQLEYQRVCVSCQDGGVISLDWPVNLDLEEEHGMDTTLLLVPGTEQGSMDENVRSFVRQSLKRGCFPIVMNPRGCAASPLTTARLFTAADSDDICTAIQFITNARPWNTMMAVGWGYGANMLTKYLAEVEERTPLTAVTCIDNPFDLEEATRSFPHHLAVDQKLTSGLIDILRSNKELFQGRAKGFNVEKALSVTSVRDFEREISMVSYGFEAIEEFYSKSSTRELVGNLKVPVLFIQSDDGTVPPFSIPRSSIAENPYTSLLLYSCLPSSSITSEKSAISWCQPFAFEWLAAVELGLLKGRHPLLKDVDVTINPFKGLTLVEDRASDKNGDVNKFLDHTQLDVLDGYPGDSINKILSGNNTSANVHPKSLEKLIQSAESKGEDNSNMLKQSSTVETKFEEIADDPVDEKSQVLQSAHVVMNMLDVTMPGTLAEEQKKKVLAAMEQGETLMKALEGAVPEDVRGKLTASVSEIVKNKRTNINLERFIGIGQVPNGSSEVKLNTEETVRDPLNAAGSETDVRSSEQMEMGDEMSHNTDTKQSRVDMPARELESDSQPSQKLQKGLDQGQSQSESSQGKAEFSRQPPSLGNDENGSLTESNLNKHGGAEKAAQSDNVVGKKDIVNGKDGMNRVSTSEENSILKNEDENLDISTDQDKQTSTSKTEEAFSAMPSSPETPLTERGSNHSQQSEGQHIQPVEEQNRQNSAKLEEPPPSLLPTSSPPSINVSQAFEALTGFDDSTQLAVNSVFGVLENIIDQFEEEKGQESDGKLDEDGDGKPPNSAPEASPSTSEAEYISKTKEHRENGPGLLSDPLKPSSHPVRKFYGKFVESHQDRSNWCDEKQVTQNCAPYSENNAGRSHGSSLSTHDGTEEEKLMVNDLIGSNISVDDLDKISHVRKFPLFLTVNPYGDSLYNEYLRQYLLSKMPNTKPLDLDSTTCLLLDYFPEDGQWKLLDQPGQSRDSVGNIGTCKRSDRRDPSLAHVDKAEIIETSYVVLNTENEQKPIKEYDAADRLIEKSEHDRSRSEELIHFVKNIVLDSLKVEVCRRLGLTHIKQMEFDLAHDLELVAEEVSLAVGHGKELTWPLESKESASGKAGTLNGEHVIKRISSAVKDAIYLRKILPVGVIVGSILASLRKHFNVATQHDTGLTGATNLGQGYKRGEKFYGQVGEVQNVDKLISGKDEYSGFQNSIRRADDRHETINKNTVMVGAVTAALGASALLVHQQGKDPSRFNGSAEVPSGSFSEKVNHHKEYDKRLGVVSEKSQNNIVSSLAEKAMSVAGPVVPTKNDGGVDQERLVAMLADFGQKGGMLKLVGKLALLWGGIRGAMSLTERLIIFLRIADRPLFQRIPGFACMVLVLWSPVVIPLFPTLVQSWATPNSSGIAVYASIAGLYIAMVILIMIWGKRIRGYKDPFEQYGLDLTSLAKLFNFLKGLAGGITLVLSLHSIHVLLGYAHFSWSLRLPSSSAHAVAWLKTCGGMLVMVGRGIVTATVVSVVEELLFRAWLPEEIAVDLGHHHAVIASGLAFAILQRSLHAIPGLWLLSLALSGARERNKGSLSIPIGMRAGIVATSFILKSGGFLIYHSHYPQWVIGKHPLQPFGGAVGFAFCLILAVLLYPRQPHLTAIQEE